MSTNADTLNVVVREERGSNKMKKLRADGLIPAVLYGHGGENISIAVNAKEVNAMIRHGGRVVEFAGGLSESALVTDVQWDAFGSNVLHMDFTRVDQSERVDVTIAVELRGTAPGTKVGGTVTQPIHEIEIVCPVTSIVEKIELSINSLELDQTITAGEVPLPPDSRLVTDASAIIVQCVEQAEESTEAEVADGAEPEVIGGKPDEEASEG